MDFPLRLESDGVVLRSIETQDLEFLRVLKNDNRKSFFFQDLISPEMQTRWFEGYRQRALDFMFVVEFEGRRCGSMGFRIKDGVADCYNIIGSPDCAGRGVMRRAMVRLCEYVAETHTTNITLSVLKENPAVGWYKKCGFLLESEGADFFKMRYPAGFPAATVTPHD